MKKSIVHQIYKFWLWNRTKRAAFIAKKTKTTVMAREKTAATMRTIAIIGIAAAMEIAAIMETQL